MDTPRGPCQRISLAVLDTVSSVEPELPSGVPLAKEAVDHNITNTDDICHNTRIHTIHFAQR
ncbi:MAG: hypothetical protein Alpg2KO_08040 [Alphaproteobacteria bacterium]